MKTKILSLLVACCGIIPMSVFAGEWMSLVDIQNAIGCTTKENGTIVLNPERTNYTFNKIRVDYSQLSSMASCYINIDYAETESTAFEFATNNTSPYYINEDRSTPTSVATLKANGTLISESVYEYDLNSICNTTDQLFYARLWQKNFLPGQVQVYVIPNTQSEPSTETDGALSGLFSVGADKKVYFSQGNLQYRASTDTWRFAENQYDTIGVGNENISESYDGWIDLFGWGTGNEPAKSSKNWGDYTTFVDWGTNAISNGGNEADIWRTLAREEWVYLFYSRTDAATLFGLGSVNGQSGLIILPDNWTTPQGVSFIASTTNGLDNNNGSYQNDNGNNLSDNIYSVEQWEIMETAGAVFLPAADERAGNKVYQTSGTYGGYWSSSKYYSSTAYLLNFYGNIVAPQSSYNRSYGKSVRLVKECAGITTANEENTVSFGPFTRKQIINGRLFILRDGKTYTVQGQEVR